MANEYITAGEFTRWRAEEDGFRKDIKADLMEIKGLVRAQNGRVSAAEACIQVIRRDLEAIKSEDLAIQRVVESIQQEGCHQYEAHQTAIKLIEGSGALPAVAPDGRARWPRLADLSVKEWTVAGVGIGALLIPAVSDLAKLATALVGWLRHAAAGLP